MTAEELCGALGAKFVAGAAGAVCELSGCYIGDLPSLAMSRIDEGNVWLATWTNVNAIAVCVLTGASCVLLCDGKMPDAQCSKKADEEGIPILVSKLSAYELAGILSRLGI